jgi:hypothetical protein
MQRPPSSRQKERYGVAGVQCGRATRTLWSVRCTMVLVRLPQAAHPWVSCQDLCRKTPLHVPDRGTCIRQGLSHMVESRPPLKGCHARPCREPPSCRTARHYPGREGLLFWTIVAMTGLRTHPEHSPIDDLPSRTCEATRMRKMTCSWVMALARWRSTECSPAGSSVGCNAGLQRSLCSQRDTGRPWPRPPWSSESRGRSFLTSLVCPTPCWYDFCSNSQSGHTVLVYGNAPRAHDERGRDPGLLHLVWSACVGARACARAGHWRWSPGAAPHPVRGVSCTGSAAVASHFSR